MLARWPKRDRLGNTVPLDPLKRRDRNRALDYFHSSYVDLVLGHLCGIRPQPDNTVVVSPLTREPFTVDRLWYHRCVFISVVVVSSSSRSSSRSGSSSRSSSSAPTEGAPSSLYPEAAGGIVFSVLVDGVVVASSSHIRPLRVVLPDHCSRKERRSTTTANGHRRARI